MVAPGGGTRGGLVGWHEGEPRAFWLWHPVPKTHGFLLRSPCLRRCLTCWTGLTDMCHHRAHVPARLGHSRHCRLHLAPRATHSGEGAAVLWGQPSLGKTSSWDAEASCQQPCWSHCGITVSSPSQALRWQASGWHAAYNLMRGPEREPHSHQPRLPRCPRTWALSPPRQSNFC